MHLFVWITGFLLGALASPTPQDSALTLEKRAACSGNDASDRSVWCDYDTSTDYYNEVVDTGETVEYWFDLTNTTAAPDGVSRNVLLINGSLPGPTIEANWGDTVIVHVSNNLQNNGTGIHWHGIRQNWTVQNDGVPSITQCPIAPGESMTYTWKATQYGTTWYHSHFALQAWEGIFGPIVIHGPATANYDEEIGPIMLNDWSHETCDALYEHAQSVGPPTLDNGLINGVNTWEDGGSRYETIVSSGSSYLMRIVNAAIDTHFRFTIDNHTMTVIATDLVPIVPYETDILSLTMGQRYDVIVSADQVEDDYWIRAIPMADCSENDSTDNIRGILRYDSSSTADPTSSAYDINSTACIDEDSSNLVPYLSQTVGSGSDTDLPVTIGTVDNVFKWYISAVSMDVAWNNPTLLQVSEGVTENFTSSQAIVELTEADEWYYFVIETTQGVPHPMHLHGHDFSILASDDDASYDDSVTLNLDNPPRRDVVTLPGSGYVVIAFKSDNPGAWLMHCHIGWHTSEGLDMQFVERPDEIAALIDSTVMNNTCAAWDIYAAADDIVQDDSGV
ncbi:multicopper oxidase [Saccharata proteae CBS 121410]|uniref:laccase n=1 Tax=Saccharata proteae CBS 121410 TaxID=1314787 RepID=A0A9P4HXY3_9PEZI|nr:multicopper oxidase [Saccharata proteae CBS 121410]